MLKNLLDFLYEIASGIETSAVRSAYQAGICIVLASLHSFCTISSRIWIKAILCAFHSGTRKLIDSTKATSMAIMTYRWQRSRMVNRILFFFKPPRNSLVASCILRGLIY